MNEVSLVGRLIRDVKHITVSDTAEVAKFTIVTEEGIKSKDGEWSTKGTFHEIDAWNGQARFMKNFSKGSVISVSGSIFNDEYEKDGVKFYKNRIRANRLTYVPTAYTKETVGSGTTTTKSAGDDVPF